MFSKEKIPFLLFCLSFPRIKVHFLLLSWEIAGWQNVSKCPIIIIIMVNKPQSRNGAAKTSLGDFLPGEGEHPLPIIHMGWEMWQGRTIFLTRKLDVPCVMPLPVSHHPGYCVSPWAVLVCSRAGLVFMMRARQGTPSWGCICL